MFTRTLARRSALLALAAVAALPWRTHAAPAGAQVEAGQATIARQGNLTTITAGNNAIINYRSFDVARFETVQFVQPSASSRVLNRINSAEPTRIDGSILANGRVYLVNPSGVLFGRDAVISAGGFIAAASQFSSADFLAGRDRFTAASGFVDNRGRITADSVALVGKYVANRGVITGRDTVTLVAGHNVYLAERDGGILVDITPAATPADPRAIAPAAVTNSGTLSAPRGRVRLGAGDMYSLATHNTGRIAARDITVADGKNTTTQIAGKLDASATEGKGGDVRITGERIAVQSATIDASGPDGGGTILVGGDWQGRATQRLAANNAQFTFVSPDSSFRADATTRGDGGSIVVWSDQSTRFYGTLSTLPGPLGGAGGRIETSGKIGLDLAGSRVKAGRGGLWLLDPRNVTIVPNTGLPYSGGVFTPVVDDAQVSAVDISAALDAGTDVTITTGSTGTQPGDINIDAVIGKGAGPTATLTFLANRNINVNAQILSFSPAVLNVVLTANTGNITQFQAIETNGGNVTLSAPNGNIDIKPISDGDFPKQILTGGGNVTLTAGAFMTVNGPVDAANGTIIFTSPNLSVRDLSSSSPILFGSGSATFNVTGILDNANFAEALSAYTGTLRITGQTSAPPLIPGITIESPGDLTVTQTTIDSDPARPIILKSGGVLTLNIDSVTGASGGLLVFASAANAILNANVRNAEIVEQNVAGNFGFADIAINSGNSGSFSYITKDGGKLGWAVGYTVLGLNANNALAGRNVNLNVAGFSEIGVGFARTDNTGTALQPSTPINTQGKNLSITSNSALVRFLANGLSSNTAAVTVNTPSDIVLSDLTTAGAQSFTAGGTIRLGSNIVAAAATFAGPVQLQGTGASSVTATGNGQVQFTGAIFRDASGGTKTLSLTSGAGGIAVEGAVGAQGSPLTSVNATATGGLLRLHDVSTSGNQTYAAATVQLNSTYTTAGGNWSAAGAVALNSANAAINTAGGNVLANGAINGNASLAINAGAGAVTLASAVGGTTPLRSLSVQGADLNIQGVTTNGTGAQNYKVNTAVGNSLGKITLNSTYFSNGRDIILDGIFTGIQFGGTISDPADQSNPDRTRIPDVATIVKRNGDLKFYTNGGRFIMGQNQRIAISGGNLVVDTRVITSTNALPLSIPAATAPGNVLPGGDIALGDITVAGPRGSGNITVDAGQGTIYVIMRTPSFTRVAGNQLIADKGTRIVATGFARFLSATPAGVPKLIVTDVGYDNSPAVWANETAASSAPGIGVTFLNSNATSLAASDGTVRTTSLLITNSLASIAVNSNVVVTESQIPLDEGAIGLPAGGPAPFAGDSGVEDMFRSLGLAPRQTSPQEQSDARAAGRLVFDDQARRLGTPGGGRTLALPRVALARAEAAAATFKTLFRATDRDAVRKQLAAAHAAWIASKSEKSFGDFVRTSPDTTQAASSLANIKTLLEQLREVGLTDAEYTAAATKLADSVRPDALPAKDFLNAL